MSVLLAIAGHQLMLLLNGPYALQLLCRSLHHEAILLHLFLQHVFGHDVAGLCFCVQFPCLAHGNAVHGALLVRVDVAPLVALETTHISHLDAEGLVPDLGVALAVRLSRSVVLSLPLELVLRLVVIFFALLSHSWRWLVHEIDAQLILAVLAEHCLVLVQILLLFILVA